MRVPSEHELLSRCRQGDESAFRELVDQYKGLVLALTTRSVTNRSRAEELAQDVFLKVYRGLPYFRGDAKLSTWIYRITINVVSQERSDLASVSLDDTGPRGDAPRARAVTEDRAFSDLVLKDRLEKAIRRLPLQYQVLVNGHYLKGLRYEDLAEALDLPMGTVKTHLHRAKRQLRHLLETEFG
ncbi:MAG TPA: sigma-70 family RNA polymerase sigma factor [Vicinamibacterales bacterium]|nr:sigma-70 family RNA polymerase sigma factor [Vicinamibacterales bacterium]